MDNQVQVDQQELAAEQEALKVRKEEDVRKEVVEEFGFDETTDKDRIDKLVKKQMDSAEKLSKAIGQKIKHRDALKKATPADPLNPNPPAPAAPTSENLSFKDQNAIIKGNVHEDDIDDVVSFAKFNKITVAEALKKPILINTLAQKAEERTTANATSTTHTRRTPSAPSEEEIVSKANKGELPEDDEGIAKLMAAKQPKPTKR